MKIETFTGFTEQGLSKKVNRFLEDNPIEVVDIKFSSSIFYMGAMVIYNTHNNS
ncbi:MULTISPECIES: hypothetical protein [Virgibacillus]|uniref:Sporulation protein Cse60 n=2 Tax=Virgibacillus TaxID=84406 RepID=A0A024QGG7_9BACI|nr:MULTISPECIES: hypothetical protein [Virgibacillus]EQB34703.1 hypothetical protein M948_20155 [Virgibacillus sp. CM-4]GGJ63383.1 hypothetical protein GCM10007111_26700 [Virgibacillus kapii]CDQ41589.1 hypothetical protein BN990_03963 [Virgibacillus massiliensis]